MKKIITGFGTAAVGAALTMALVAGAQTASPTPAASNSPAPSPAPEVKRAPMILQVGPAGRVLLRGTIDAVSSGSLTVKSWGGDWTINVSASTRVLPALAGSDLAKFSTNDYVGVNGTVSQSAPWTIDATLVRDETYRAAAMQEEHQNLQEVRKEIRSERPRTYQGTASNVAGSSLTLTAKNGASYSVNISSNAKILDRNWLTIPAGNLQNGDTVRVWGANASGTISASVVRDVSLPANAGQNR